jgi:hypothetical protein
MMQWPLKMMHKPTPARFTMGTSLQTQQLYQTRRFNMLGSLNFAKSRKLYTGIFVALLVSLLFPVANPQPLYAQEEELGYLWALTFDFNSGFDGVLTIDVGPWVEGELVEVNESSTARVQCKPVGAVGILGGTAAFNGGHLECSMDLAAIVLRNHGLQINKMDTYGSILAKTQLMSTAPTVAPIFTHADASYSIDFTQTSQVTLQQQLNNKAGLVTSTFMNTVLFTWQTYHMEYICVFGGGPCEGRFAVGAAPQVTPTAGVPTSFATGPMTFQVGGAALNGQMDWLLIDPGNSAH